MRPPLNLTLPFAIRGSRPAAFRARGPRRGSQAARTSRFNQRVIDVLDVRYHRQYYRRNLRYSARTITPESHAINDLGIDSLDFLDIAFAIDKAFGIKLPLEQWTQEVNEGKATTEQYFVLKNLCAPHRRAGRRQGRLIRRRCASSISS